MSAHFHSLNSVRMRLTLWNVGVLALVLVILGFILWYGVQANLIASVDRDLSGRVHRFQSRWGHDEHHFLGPPKRPPGPPPEPRPPEPGLTRLRPRVFDPQGKALFPQAGDVPWSAAPLRMAISGMERFTTIRAGGERIRIISAPLRRGTQIIGVVQMAYPLAEIDRSLHSLSRTLLTLIPLALIVTGFGGAFLTGRMIRPVRDMTHAASRIGAQDLSRRLPVIGRDEFAEMAATFNSLLDRLERAFEQQRRFTGDASHELRTPLTAILANTSLVLNGPATLAESRQALAATQRAATRMNRIVQDLLLLARSDAGQVDLDLRPVPLRPLLEAAVEGIVTANAASLTLTLPEPPLAIVGEPNALIRLFTNLLDNAIRHTPPTGRIQIGAASSAEMVTVSVEDTGEGIPPEHLPHVCDRFYRIDQARSRALGGTGLGLAISRSIVEAHGGRLALESRVGVGTRVSVTLPRADPPASDEASTALTEGVQANA